MDQKRVRVVSWIGKLLNVVAYKVLSCRAMMLLATATLERDYAQMGLQGLRQWTRIHGVGCAARNVLFAAVNIYAHFMKNEVVRFTRALDKGLFNLGPLYRIKAA